MRKKVIKQPSGATPTGETWLDLAQLAQVEVTSEEEANPVESALLLGSLGQNQIGWRAAEPGEQLLRLLFDEPQTLRRISLVFETKETRTQEFVLRYLAASGQFQEVARQQFNFSEGGANQEVETYEVNLEGVEVLELVITPDISGGEARASLERLRLA